jgi:hypothetical protein
MRPKSSLGQNPYSVSKALTADSLDGLNHLTLQFIDRDRLGLDLLKSVWTPDMADDVTGTRATELKEHVDRCGRARIILSRCDSDEAVRFGQSLGITMYQGRYVDRLLANESRID